MNIYIFHKDNIVDFELPKIPKGTFLLSDTIDNKKVDLMTIEASNNQWIAYSNEDAQIIVNEKTVDKVALYPNSFYSILLYNTERINIYTNQSYDSNYVMKMIKNDTKVVIGSDDKYDILFPILQDMSIELSYKDNRYYMKSMKNKFPIYVNKIRKDSGYLSNFDVIFILGIKIIIVGPYLFVNDPGKLITNYSLVLSNPKYAMMMPDYNSNGRIYKNFYSDNEYFVKSPLFHNKLKKYEFTIAPPPSTEKSKNSILMQTVPSVAMSITSVVTFYYTFKRYSAGQETKESFITSLIMCIVMLFTGILWPVIEVYVEKFTNFLMIKRNKKIYKKYIKSKEKEISECRIEQQMAFRDIYADMDVCVDAINKKTSRLFSVGIDNPHFLSIRLGTGSKPFSASYRYEKPEFSLYENKLYDMVDKMLEKYKMLDNVPITVSLKEKSVVAFLGNDNVNKYNYMKGILLQLAALHSYADLKIVVLTTEYAKEEFNYFKNLNHCWDSMMSTHFFASNFTDALDVSSYLEKKFAERSNKDTEKNIDCHYLIVCDSIEMYRELNIIKYILNSKTNLGFSLAIFDDKLSDVPNSCKSFVNYSADGGYYFESEMEKNSNLQFSDDVINAINKYDFDKEFLTLCNIPIKIDIENSNNLPTKLGFLEMMGVGKVELLNVEKRWKDSDVVHTLSTPIGVDANGNIVNLDLHEKRHGPHGLIAGMTGSGKSEFIITFILSLSINYSPEEVQFVLIDYKGGGLAGAFENRQKNIKLPHLAGTITNLDKSEMYRTLASIESELKRRQKVFNKVKEELDTGTIDIYKYQQLYREKKVEEPMSHLFIISDEFAELKAQQPDFMDKLVSTARIGRSLGVHLILATQKPSGVVDEQIWSNSKFKVCCKVQTPEDSQEMLGKPDAASLKESGRFYLQVGYDAYSICGQSAYSGVKYIPSNKVASNIDEGISLLNDTGVIINTIDTAEDDKAEAKTNDVDLGEELTNILKYLIDVADNIGYKSSNLWLDNIPNKIYIGDLQNKYPDLMGTEYGILNPVVGEYDDPQNQKQSIVRIPITLGGNCYIAGITGSGKTTFLSTLITSTILVHKSNEVNFYIIDFGNEALKKFEKAPQVANVLTIENSDKVNVLLNRVIDEIKNRKKLLSKLDTDYISYVKSKQKPYLPNYILIINGFDTFREQFEDFVDEEFTSILRDCVKYGIIVIISSVTTNALSAAQFDLFNQKIAFKFNDAGEYSDFLGTNLAPAGNPGRGLISIDNEVYQFQTSLVAPENVLNDTLNQLFTKISTVTYSVEGIPIMPDFVTSDLFNGMATSLDRVPVGYNKQTIQPAYFNFNDPISVVLSSKSKRIKNFMTGVSNLISGIEKTKVLVLDGNKKLNINNDKIKYYDGGFVKLMSFLMKNLEKYDASSDNRIVVVISGYEVIDQHLKKYYEKEGMDNRLFLNDFIQRAANNSIFRFVICGTYMSASNFENEKWYVHMPKRTGIVLMESFSDQEVINAKALPNEYSLELDDTNGFVSRNGEKEVIKYISD